MSENNEQPSSSPLASPRSFADDYFKQKGYSFRVGEEYKEPGIDRWKHTAVVAMSGKNVRAEAIQRRDDNGFACLYGSLDLMQERIDKGELVLDNAELAGSTEEIRL